MGRAPSAVRQRFHVDRLQQPGRCAGACRGWWYVRRGVPADETDRTVAHRPAHCPERPVSLSMTGALLGGVAGGGLLCAIAYAPPLRRPSLEDRVGPYLRDGR